MANVLAGLQPESVWSNFEALTQVPRPSKQEEKAIAFIKKWAEDRGFAHKSDKLGNLVISKPATPGMENRLPICIQGHIDMVCEKNNDVEFDFENDPLKIYIDGDWVKAQGTTLGADNGIGLAMGMALLEANDIPHPAVEILCTLDEETGLTGAIQLGTDLLNAKILLNLDSEEDDAFTIGCAGGINAAGHYKYESADVPADSTAYKVTVKGLRGGHSGIEINDGRGNALKFLTRIVYNAQAKFNVCLNSINGGNKHNAIPRESFGVIVVPNAAKADFEKFIVEFNATSKKEFATKEPNLTIFAEVTETPARVMTRELQNRLIGSFYAMPHGVMRMSPDIQGLVQSSTNFAIVETRENEVYVLTSQRSSVETEKINVANKVKACFELGGASVVVGDGYPAWEPCVTSPIVAQSKLIYTELFGHEPKIEAIHAGLECGLIGEKYPGMDMISFGPNLKDVHSPDEKVSISSVQKVWTLFKEIVKNIPEA